jgi:integrase/recombinase XerD
MSTPKKERRLFIVRQTELAQDVTAFLIDRQARGLSPKTVEYYACKLRLLQTWLEGQNIRRVQDITANDLRQFLLYLTETEHNPGGCHCFFRVSRTFLRWCWFEFELPAPNPIVRVKAPKLPQVPLEPVPLSDLKAMLAVCQRRTFTGDRDRAILLALLDTGCRASEFLALNAADVNLSTGAAIIRQGKGGKWRVVFLGAKTRRELVRYLRHRTTEGPLWVTVKGKRLRYSGLRQIVRRRAVKAGVSVPSLHSFRRAFALTCLRAGMDVYSLQKLMGHSDLSVLRRYLQQTEADLQAVHQKAGPVDRML